MKRKIKLILLTLALLAFGTAIIICPERYVNCCFTGFCMWAECVLPSLFPFMVITMILTKTGVAERASLPLRAVSARLKFPPASASCFALAVCSGYPAGSKVVAEFCQSGAIPKSQSAKCAYLCSTGGPLFIIGSVGYKMLGDRTAGFKILLAHILSVAVISVIIALCSKKPAPAPRRVIQPDKNVLYNAFYGAVIAVCVAGGFIAFFYVVAFFCADFKLFYPLEYCLSPLVGERASAVCLGLIEATTGCKELSVFGADKLGVALCGFLVTFGGLSILLQQLSYLVPAGVNPAKFIFVKLLQGLLCFGVLLIIA